MTKQFFYTIFIAFILIFASSPLTSGDLFHFYRASPFLGEPRFEKKGLSSLDSTTSGGYTHLGRSHTGDKTNLLDVYGPTNMRALGLGIRPTSSPDHLDTALTNLALTPARDGFAQLSFAGKFSLVETNIWVTQNICNGFFFQAHLPIRSMKVNAINYTDLSPTDTLFPNITTPSWQTFLTLLPEILQKYTVNIGPSTQKGIGDITFLTGWTYTYQQHPILDFIDATIKIGITFPAGSIKNETTVFSLPLGNNGHTGMPVQCDVAFGIYEWITVGGQGGALFFNQKNTHLHMKTHASQNGFIKLAQGKASINKGTIWHCSGYIKADHFFRGLSFVCGYTFVQENPSSFTPLNHTLFDHHIINSDAAMKGWNMGTLHFMLDYDFAQEQRVFCPKIGIFYDQQLHGNHTFNTSITGGAVGCDLAWNF